MESPLFLVDDKHLPLYRIVWVSDTSHFCGEEDCMCEGRYEVRLEADESLWAKREERDCLVTALQQWCGDVEGEGPAEGEL